MANQKYLTNKELLHEINESKKTYCYFIDEKYEDYDYIVYDLNDITEEIFNEAIEARQKRLKEKSIRELVYEQNFSKKNAKKEISEEEFDVNKNDVVFRVICYNHVPEKDTTGKNIKEEKDKYIKLNFEPFKHFVYENNNWKEVGRSHWVNGLHNGHFSMDHGHLTNRLARMFMDLVKRYSTAPSWNRYTYLDELKSNALVQLSDVALKFKEHKSNNPFAFYTQIVKNSFRGALKEEKKVRNIQDEYLMSSGYEPSFNKQVEHEQTYAKAKELAEISFNMSEDEFDEFIKEQCLENSFSVNHPTFKKIVLSYISEIK